MSEQAPAPGTVEMGAEGNEPARYRNFDALPVGALETMAKVCIMCGSVVINARRHDAWHDDDRSGRAPLAEPDPNDPE